MRPFELCCPRFPTATWRKFLFLTYAIYSKLLPEIAPLLRFRNSAALVMEGLKGT
jgi:hypothetical protein